MSSAKRVAIVGAGAAGLCTARSLVAYNSQKLRLEPVVFEKSSCLGGTWVYQDVPSNGAEVHSSLYRNLQTNLPKEVMLFPGFPFPENVPSFMHHTVVRQYLDDFANNCGLHKFIHFNHEVTRIRPLFDSGSGSPAWEVQVLSLCRDSYFTEVFDAVVVCNGHYSAPHYPIIDGIDKFRGRLMHSHYYRDPVEFSGLRVAVLGFGPSGSDIALQLCEVCPRVLLSHYSEPLDTPLPENLVQKCCVSAVTADGQVLFLDGSAEKVDALVLCTGYDFHFPFLTAECNVDVQEKWVNGLYKHIFNISTPSLAFVGLPWTVVPFPLFHAQSMLVAAVLTEDLVLPSACEMMEDTRKKWKLKEDLGVKPHHFHKMASEQFAYVSEILELAKCEQNPSIIEEIYAHITSYRRHHLMSYKNTNYKILECGKFTFIEG